MTFQIIPAHYLFRNRLAVMWIWTYGTPGKWSTRRGFDVQIWRWHFRFCWKRFGHPDGTH